MQASLIGNRIYVFAGEDPHRRPLADLWYLDLNTMAWGSPEVTGTPPSPRSAHAATAYQNRYLLVFGGVEGQGGDARGGWVCGGGRLVCGS